MKKESKNNDGGWILSRIEIKFQKGYSFKDNEEEKHDRYIGWIDFENEDSERFNLKIPSSMTTRYMELMREDIIKTAENLGKKIAESIKITDRNNKYEVGKEEV